MPLEMRTLQQGRSVRGCIKARATCRPFCRLIALYRAGQLPIERAGAALSARRDQRRRGGHAAGTTIKAVLQIGTA